MSDVKIQSVVSRAQSILRGRSNAQLTSRLRHSFFGCKHYLHLLAPWTEYSDLLDVFNSSTFGLFYCYQPHDFIGVRDTKFDFIFMSITAGTIHHRYCN